MIRVQRGSFPQKGRMDLGGEGWLGQKGVRGAAFLVWGLTFDPVMFPLEPNPSPFPSLLGELVPQGTWVCPGRK